jgi:hypothetical protein
MSIDQKYRSSYSGIVLRRLCFAIFLALEIGKGFNKYVGYSVWIGGLSKTQ